MNASSTVPAATAPSMPPLDLTKTFGALLIALIFSSVLYGVTLLQAFLYFQNYQSDGVFIKITVAALVIFETLHSAFGAHAIYFYVITNYMNPSALAKATWSATMTLGSSVAIILIVHMFYIRRIYHISQRNILLVIFLVMLSLARLGTSVAVEVRAFELKLFSELIRNGQIIIAALSLAAGIDIIISAVLSFYLHRSRSGVPTTDTLINKLMTNTIHNGALTSLFDIVVVIMLATEDNNLIFLAIFQVVGNLYTNSMLATLNSRQSLKAAHLHIMPTSAGSHFPMSTLRLTKNTSPTIPVVASLGQDSKHRDLEIAVTTERSQMTEK